MHRPLLLATAIALVVLLVWKRPYPTFHVGHAGIVVDQVDPETATATGLMPGDVLLSWTGDFTRGDRRESVDGEFGSPFDLIAIAQTSLPEDRILLTFDRDGGRLRTVLPADWRLQSRPRMQPNDLIDYLIGQQLLDNDNPAEGLARWNDLARRFGRQREHHTAAWLFWRIGLALSELGETVRADQAFEAALDAIKGVDDGAASLIRIARTSVLGA